MSTTIDGFERFDESVSRIIKITDKVSLQAVCDAMRRRESFVIVTDDPRFDPLGYDQHSAEVWLAAAGGGALMAIGAGTLLLAFLDPEPTSKLTLLVGGGIAMVLAGGGVIIGIALMRRNYSSRVVVNHETGEYRWILQPK